MHSRSHFFSPTPKLCSSNSSLSWVIRLSFVILFLPVHCFSLKNEKSYLLPSTLPHTPSVHCSILICLARMLERSCLHFPYNFIKTACQGHSALCDFKVNCKFSVFYLLDLSVASEIATDSFMLNGQAFFFLHLQKKKNVFCCEQTSFSWSSSFQIFCLVSLFSAATSLGCMDLSPQIICATL